MRMRPVPSMARIRATSNASIHVPGDTTTSAQHLTSSSTPFRLTRTADIAMATAVVGVGVLLFLLPLRSLTYRSGLFPRPRAVLLTIAGCSWVIDTLATFLWPELPTVVHTILTAPTIAEFWLIAYLLLRDSRPAAGHDLAPSAEVP